MLGTQALLIEDYGPVQSYDSHYPPGSEAFSWGTILQCPINCADTA